MLEKLAPKREQQNKRGESGVSLQLGRVIPAAAGFFNGYPAGNADSIIHLDESKMAWLYGMISGVRKELGGNYCREENFTVFILSNCKVLKSGFVEVGVYPWIFGFGKIEDGPQQYHADVPTGLRTH